MKELLDKLVDEKMDWKEYEAMAEEMENQEYKDMFNMIADQEHSHYKMIREYITQMYEKED